ncbi:hypothetical protein IZU99_09975 [Oscillospiraceae bacterium CM]|nr:hypothetical protein IZU99_09975 [Oscillospiraceae bacterium CM]
MTTVSINPGICSLMTKVEAVASENKKTVTLTVESACDAVNKMMAEVGSTFKAYDICLVRPGVGPFYDYASKKFPVHVSCPVIAGIIKCAEVECRLALPRDAEIRFEKKENT